MLLILVIVIGCLSYAKVTHRPLPIQFFNVLTGSMADTFKPNSLVVVGRVNFEKLKVGDIISYESEKALVTHRIEAITGQGKNRRLVTKGDSNQAIDATPVTA
ncbi:MAG: signal peptidase I [Pseudolactococcus laudensis]